ncbi:protein kinase domain-containing protein [Sorangium sp. So ce1153]|uniref:protein kinase domain-containing protein n=1 Tax=Sorangium sp. So ce1153 TaxID=3133333 RepID=UPI003F6193AE
MAEERRKGDRVGPWRLERYLGRGGNAEVWEAIHDHGSRAALKMLSQQFWKPGSQRYKRFCDEITALQQLRSRPGVLALIDACAPEHPSHDSPPWLATVLAIEVTKYIRKNDASLADVVDAIATFAETLASLHADSYFHRDIKPANLYNHAGAWVIGDFGLVDFPEKTAETVHGEKLGAENYIAPEMLLGKPGVSGASVDVYALAKTLWVLAAGQTYPPPGLQRVEDRGLVLDAYISHPRAYLLDRLIEHATSPNASDRPSMAQMGAELRAWLAAPVSVRLPSDLSSLASRLAALHEPARRADELQKARLERAKEAYQTLEWRLRPLVKQLSEVVPFPVEFGAGGLIRNMARQSLAGKEDEWNTGIEAVVRSPGDVPVTLWSGAALFLMADGNLCIAAGHAVSAHPARGPITITWMDLRTAKVGSAEQEQAIGHLVNDLAEHCCEAVEGFLSVLASKL